MRACTLGRFHARARVLTPFVGTAQAAVEEGIYDLIGFGRWFISNPDLPNRIKTGAPLNVYDTYIHTHTYNIILYYIYIAG